MCSSKLIIGLLFASPILACAQTDETYVSIVGQKQGKFQGDVTTKGLEGSITCYQAETDVLSPVDAATGLSTGKRMHKPITLTLKTSAASILLQNSMSQNENLTSVTLGVYQRSATTGSSELLYTIVLTNAHLSDIAIKTRTAQDAGSTIPTAITTVSFTYQKIAWTWAKGGITAMDDWSN